MSVLRLPKIDGSTNEEQLTQIKKYLFQLVGELQFALNSSPLAKDVIEQGESGGWIYKKQTNGVYEMFGTFNVSPGSFALHNLLYQSNDISIATPFKVKTAFVSGCAAGCNWITNAGLLNNGNIVLKITSDSALNAVSSIELRLHVVGTYV